MGDFTTAGEVESVTAHEVINIIPYEIIVRATNGEPEAVDEVLRHYSKRIRIAAIENGHIDRDTEDSIKSRLVAALFKFRFDEQPYHKTE